MLITSKEGIVSTVSYGAVQGPSHMGSGGGWKWLCEQFSEGIQWDEVDQKLSRQGGALPDKGGNEDVEDRYGQITTHNKFGNSHPTVREKAWGAASYLGDDLSFRQKDADMGVYQEHPRASWYLASQRLVAEFWNITRTLCSSFDGTDLLAGISPKDACKDLSIKMLITPNSKRMRIYYKWPREWLMVNRRVLLVTVPICSYNGVSLQQLKRH